MRRALLVLPALLAALLAAAPPAAAQEAPLACTGDPSEVRRLDLRVGGQPAYGLTAAPAGAPRTLAVFGHGYSYNVDAWRAHLRRTARREGALALVMNYRGLTDLPRGPEDRFERSRGYPVKAGGEDLVAAAQAALRACPTIRHGVLLGISMGANTTGLALARAPKRPDGRPLFDLWIGTEGAYDVLAIHAGARALAPVNVFAANARTDIERETGGTPEQVPGAYAERSVVQRAPDIARSGIRGAILVHGAEDGLAPYDGAQRMARGLREGGVPTDLFTVGRRAPGDDEDTTLSSYSGRGTDNAGHGPEWSERHVVIDLGFDRLDALVRRGAARPCGRDYAVDGTATPRVSPDPDAPAAGCPAGPALPGAQPVPPATGPSSAPGPALSVRVATTRRRRLVVTADVIGAPTAVRVAVSRAAGSRCRFVTPRGRLTAPRSCDRPVLVRVRGGRAVFARRPPGRLRVLAVAGELRRSLVLR